jgi:hypothetical protein
MAGNRAELWMLLYDPSADLMPCDWTAADCGENRASRRALLSILVDVRLIDMFEEIFQ